MLTHRFGDGGQRADGRGRAAEAADLEPDRISYTRVLRIIRRTATGTAAFPPSALD